ncbi:Gfo/Idh/MocA family protein [Streptomyces sp. WMMB 322]|uniref:Gfo/Idh/MocA family protein n=1 Tax=Streptomyces sp. WMMB 322 TaxID=1286821 RepID=UPI000823A11C|nr:Gfo/Idh/MocA family oxidoreductase [Streptomyces sp. WMMB 322]SCK13442.1 myo-inositol 2-dehydrogenase / D-chiro-inositol 1-dehydrogenase [Streptomyces sp. WMMB 322]
MPELAVGLIGAGGIARAHLPAWLELGARVTVFTPDDSGGKLAAEYAQQGVRAASSLGELLDEAEAVDVCTPTHTHREVALTALRAGRHVACEKPLALTVEDVEEMIAEAERAGVLLFPAHVVRYFPEYAAMADAVAGGAVGEPAVLRFTRTGTYPVWSPWFADPSLSGGLLVDQMIHDFDFARLLAGEVARVHAHVRGHQEAPALAGCVAAGTAVLTHASGAVSHVHGVWGLPDTQFRTTFRIAGRRGVLHHDSAQTKAFRVISQGRATEGEGIPATNLTESPFLTELREFARAVRGGPAPRVSARDGLAAVRIALAAAESAHTGRAVDMAGGNDEATGVREPRKHQEAAQEAVPGIRAVQEGQQAHETGEVTR